VIAVEPTNTPEPVIAPDCENVRLAVPASELLPVMVADCEKVMADVPLMSLVDCPYSVTH